MLSRRSLLAGASAAAISSVAPSEFENAQAPVGDLADDDDVQYLDVGRLRGQYIDYLTTKSPEIEEQKEARRYYHGAQLSEEERRVLRRRGQPPVIINAIAKKINRIVGLTERVHYDPKAFPRNRKGEPGADIATETVRYALEANDWKTRDPQCVLQCAIEGIAGIELKLVEGDHDDPDIALQEVLGDDFFYDPRSVRFDFSDARYMGVAKWVDVEVAIEMFPDREDDIRGLIENGSDLTTFADREFRWINLATNRIRLVEHWYKHKSKWCWCFYISFTMLDEGVSPFHDKRGKTAPRFVMWRAAVDHDGDSYGFFRNLKSLQDEKNQRRSRILHIANNKRLLTEKGVVDDIEVTRREWARSDGIVETNPGGLAKIKADDTTFELQAHVELMKATDSELDNFANVDAATMTGGNVGNLSGYAITLLQQPGLAEIGFFLLGYRGWKLRLYELIWTTQQRYWTAEREIRVSGDDELTDWLDINGMELDEYGQPTMVNYLGAIDVNFRFDEGPDMPNTMADVYEVVKNDPNVPWQVKLELMPISRKRKQEIMQKSQQQPDPIEIMGKKLTLEGMDASNQAARAVAAREAASAADKLASAQGRRAKAFKDVVDAAVDAAHFGLDAAGAAQTWRQDAPTVPVDFTPPAPPMPQPPAQAAPAPQPAPMPPPGIQPPSQYSLPF